MSSAVDIGSTGPIKAFRSSVSLVESSHEEDDFTDYPELDFGPLRVRVPPDAVVRMSNDDRPYSDAVYFDFPTGSVRLSLFAAPRNHPVWPERAEEIAGIQTGIGAQVSSVWGDWGRELHIVHGGEYNWVIGVDGSRWMLLGRATWTAPQGWELVELMRAMIRTARVDRGAEPMPVRAPIGLARPGAVVEDQSLEPDAPYAAVVTMRTPDREPHTGQAPGAVHSPGGGGQPGEFDHAAEPSPVLSLAVARTATYRRSFTLPGRAAAAAAAAIAVVTASLWLTHQPASPDRTMTAMPAPATPGTSVVVPESPTTGSTSPAVHPPAASKPRVPSVTPTRPAPTTPPPLGQGRERDTTATPVEANTFVRPGERSAASAGSRSERVRSERTDRSERRRTESDRGQDRHTEGRRSNQKSRPRGAGPTLGPLDDLGRLPHQLLQIAPGL